MKKTNNNHIQGFQNRKQKIYVNEEMHDINKRKHIFTDGFEREKKKKEEFLIFGFWKKIRNFHVHKTLHVMQERYLPQSVNGDHLNNVHGNYTRYNQLKRKKRKKITTRRMNTNNRVV